MSRISPGSLLLAVIAVVAGLLGAYIIKQQMEQQETAEPAPTEEAQTFTVPLASTDLQQGREITLGDIAIYRMTAEQLKEQGIDGPFMSNTQQIIGRTLRQDLAKGSIFDTGSLYPEGLGPSVADLLEPGKRAITVPVELDAAVAGFATPGTWVDVVFRSQNTREQELPEVAVTLLERVKVLAVNQETFEGSRTRSSQAENASVTLEVSPDEATTLRVVDGRGTLALALRHPDDEASFSRQNPLSLDQVLNLPPSRTHQMEVFRGKRITRVDFQGQRDSTTYVNRVAVQDEPEDDDDNVPAVPTSAPVVGEPSGGGE